MKAIPVEQLNERLTKALEQQHEHEAIGLTNDSGTVAWVARVPEALRDSEADLVTFTEGPADLIFRSLANPQQTFPFAKYPH